MNIKRIACLAFLTLLGIVQEQTPTLPDAFECTFLADIRTAVKGS